MNGNLRFILSTLEEAFGWRRRTPPLTARQRDEQAAFLAAIRTNIHDDAPRLIYADWLREQGGLSREARAEFISIQCELGREIQDRFLTNETMGRDVALLKRWRRVWEIEYSAFTSRPGTGSPKRGLYSVRSCSWRRGFPENIETSGVPDHEPDPAANCFPTLQSWSSLLGEPDVERFAAIAFTDDVSNLNRLHLYVDGARAGDDIVAILVHTPHPRRLRELTLVGEGLTDRGVAILANAPLARSLRNLHLRGYQLGDETLRVLATTSGLSELSELELGGFSISDVGAIAMAESPYLKGLKELVLTDTNVGPRGRAALHESKTLCECSIHFPTSGLRSV